MFPPSLMAPNLLWDWGRGVSFLPINRHETPSFQSREAELGVPNPIVGSAQVIPDPVQATLSCHFISNLL
jgi:hypothetical protein